MDINAQKEQFSHAYVQALAAVAGYAWYRPSVDDDSVDMGIAAKGGRGTIRSPRLELQLKCHAGRKLTSDQFSFPLRTKNYDELRDETLQVSRILVVVLVPEDKAEWCESSETEMILRHCSYWISLRGYPDVWSDAQDPRVAIHISRTQVMSPNILVEIMERIASGGYP